MDDPSQSTILPINIAIYNASHSEAELMIEVHNLKPFMLDVSGRPLYRKKFRYGDNRYDLRFEFFKKDDLKKDIAKKRQIVIFVFSIHHRDSYDEAKDAYIKIRKMQKNQPQNSKIFVLAGNLTCTGHHKPRIKDEEIRYYLRTHSITYHEICAVSDFNVRTMLTESVKEYVEKHHDHHGDLLTMGIMIGGILFLLITLIVRMLFF